MQSFLLRERIPTDPGVPTPAASAPVSSPDPLVVEPPPLSPAGFSAAFRQFFEDLVERIPYVLLAVALLGLAVLAGRLTRRLVESAVQRTKGERHVALLVGRLVELGVLGIGILVALSVVGLNIGVLLGSLGLASLALGLALQDLLANFFAGLVLLLERPFTRGDHIAVEDSERTLTEGVVEDIRVRATHLRTPDGQLVLVPNTLLFSNVVRNASAAVRRRLQLRLHVARSEDPDRVRRLLLAVVPAVPGVADDPVPRAVSQGLEGGALRIDVWFWVDPASTDMLRVRGDVLERADQALRDAGVDLSVSVLTATVPDMTSDHGGPPRRSGRSSGRRSSGAARPADPAGEHTRAGSSERSHVGDDEGTDRS